MANNSNNVSAAKPKVAGAIFCAPLGTEIPTDAKTQLSENFKPLGYISDSGIVNSNTSTNNSVKAWGGDIVLTALTEKSDSFKFTLIECLNVETLKVVYGDENVSGTLEEGIVIKSNAKNQKSLAWVIDMILSGGVLKRITIPNGKVSEVGEVTYVDGEPIGYTTTVATTPDNEGNTHYEYIVKPS